MSSFRWKSFRQNLEKCEKLGALDHLDEALTSNPHLLYGNSLIVRKQFAGLIGDSCVDLEFPRDQATKRLPLPGEQNSYNFQPGYLGPNSHVTEHSNKLHFMADMMFRFANKIFDCSTPGGNRPDKGKYCPHAEGDV